MGLGAALLIAALLLSTYTTGKIAKIPLDVDATLISDGTGTAFDPASLNGDRFVIDRNVPLAMQEQISVESPSNADVRHPAGRHDVATHRQAAGRRAAAGAR